MKTRVRVASALAIAFASWALVSGCGGVDSGEDAATEDGVAEDGADAASDAGWDAGWDPSPTAPTTACNWMDWELSPDGFYLISQFGTTDDPTTMGRTTSCGYLQGHYDAYGCRYDLQTSSCLDFDTAIPHVQGQVDYEYQDVLDEVDRYAPADVPWPEILLPGLDCRE